MNHAQGDYFTRRQEAMPGRPNLVNGQAAPDAAIGKQALMHLPRRARIIAMPNNDKPRTFLEALDDPESLSETQQRRLQYAVTAINYLKNVEAIDIETSIPAKDLSVILDCKIKAVSNYLSFGINEGAIRKIRKSLNPKRPSETCAHYFLGKHYDE